MPQIEVSEETLEKIREQLGDDFNPVELDSLDDMVGQKWFFRTVTYHLVGKITKRIGNFFQLEEASWIADSGRFMNFIKNGDASEVEPVGKVLVNMNTIVDAYPWKHKLPKEQI